MRPATKAAIPAIAATHGLLNIEAAAWMTGPHLVARLMPLSKVTNAAASASKASTSFGVRWLSNPPSAWAAVTRMGAKFVKTSANVWNKFGNAGPIESTISTIKPPTAVMNWLSAGAASIRCGPRFARAEANDLKKLVRPGPVAVPRCTKVVATLAIAPPIIRNIGINVSDASRIVLKNC